MIKLIVYRDCSSMAERNLAMVEVVGSIPVSRSINFFFFIIFLKFSHLNKNYCSTILKTIINFFTEINTYTIVLIISAVLFISLLIVFLKFTIIKTNIIKYIKINASRNKICKMIYSFLKEPRYFKNYYSFNTKIDTDINSIKLLIENLQLQ
jgi:hypothetical protein